MIENNKDVILFTVPWQLLSCHYTIMKSFPCLTWKLVIMIKNNSEMSINAMPLLPRVPSPEIPACSGFHFSVHFLLWSYYHHSGGHDIAWNPENLGKVFFLKLILLELREMRMMCEMKQPFINNTRRGVMLVRAKRKKFDTRGPLRTSSDRTVRDWSIEIVDHYIVFYSTWEHHLLCLYRGLNEESSLTISATMYWKLFWRKKHL